VTRSKEREREYNGIKDRNTVRVIHERRYCSQETRCSFTLNALLMQGLKQAKCNIDVRL
jgi:hypothetical protein